MSDYVFEIGEDNFPKFNREYVSMNTSEGLRITIALVVSGIPFSGHFDKNRISFAYDADYKSAAQEIIAKASSEEFDEMLREVKEHSGEDCLYFLPTVANILRMTVGTLSRRPLDIQLAVCKRYVDNWYCDTYTIQHELRDAMMLITKPEMTDSEKDKAVGKD